MQLDVGPEVCKGKASALIDRLNKRRELGLCTPRQADILIKFGFQHTYDWKFEEASKMIGRLAAVSWQKWRLPFDTAEYIPPSLKGAIEWT